MGDAAAVVGDHARLVVERQIFDRLAVVADRGQHQPGLDRLHLVGAGDDELHPGGSLLPRNALGRQVVGQPDPRPRRRARRRRRVAERAQDLQLLPRQGVGDGGKVAQHRFAVGVGKNDLGGGRQPDQLGQGERRMLGSAAGRDDDLLHP